MRQVNRIAALAALAGAAVLLSRLDHRPYLPPPAPGSGPGAAGARLSPAVWQSVDEKFAHCGLGALSICGMRTKHERPDVVRQPGASHGQLAYCLVSGAVFQVDGEQSARGVADGRPVYLCCGSCAQYFEEHRDFVLAARGIARRS